MDEKWIEIKKFGVKININNVKIIDNVLLTDFEYEIMDKSVKFNEDELKNYLEKVISIGIDKIINNISSKI